MALICKGHGSDYYEEVVDIFEKRDFNIDGKSKKIRGGLLTSLLLIADELDLHKSRSVLQGNFPLSKLSKLHYYRHHYVEHVEVARNVEHGTGVDRRINIELAFPSGEHMWREDLKVWVENKLKIEIARTFEQVRSGFDGRFSWMDPSVCLIDNEALPKVKNVDGGGNSTSFTVSNPNNHRLESVYDGAEKTVP